MSYENYAAKNVIISSGFRRKSQLAKDLCSSSSSSLVTSSLFIGFQLAFLFLLCTMLLLLRNTNAMMQDALMEDAMMQLWMMHFSMLSRNFSGKMALTQPFLDRFCIFLVQINNKGFPFVPCASQWNHTTSLWENGHNSAISWPILDLFGTYEHQRNPFCPMCFPMESRNLLGRKWP